jgi:hypothetical protein
MRRLEKAVTVVSWCGQGEETRYTWIQHWHLVMVTTPLFHSRIVLTPFCHGFYIHRHLPTLFSYILRYEVMSFWVKLPFVISPVFYENLLFKLTYLWYFNVWHIRFLAICWMLGNEIYSHFYICNKHNQIWPTTHNLIYQYCHHHVIPNW